MRPYAGNDACRFCFQCPRTTGAQDMTRIITRGYVGYRGDTDDLGNGEMFFNGTDNDLVRLGEVFAMESWIPMDVVKKWDDIAEVVFKEGLNQCKAEGRRRKRGT